MSSDTTIPASEQPHGETVAIKMFPDMDPRFPLSYLSIAVHLGIPVWRAKDAEENLRRSKALIKTYRELGITLISKSDGSAFTEDDVTPELIAQHEGQEPNLGTHSPASFDDHLLDIIASQTGKRRVSYVHIRKHTPTLSRPTDIYQETDDKTGTELRRVEVYLDGRHLWVEDNCEGTGEIDKDDTHFPGLTILNARPGQVAALIKEEEFEKLWDTACSPQCGWITELQDQGISGLPGAEAIHCDKNPGEGTAYCAEHAERVRRMFPRLTA